MHTRQDAIESATPVPVRAPVGLATRGIGADGTRGGLLRAPAARRVPANAERLRGLATLCALTGGSRHVRIGWIDGPVNTDHDLLKNGHLLQDVLPGDGDGGDGWGDAPGAPSAAATFGVSLLMGHRGTGLCGDCTLLSLPVPPRMDAVLRAVHRGIDWCAHVLVLALDDFTPVMTPEWLRASERAAARGIRLVCVARPGQELLPRAWIPLSVHGESDSPPGGLHVPMVELRGAALTVGSTLRREPRCALAHVAASFALLAALRRDLAPARIWSALLHPHERSRDPVQLDVSAALLNLGVTAAP